MVVINLGQKYEKMENFITFAIHNRVMNNKKNEKSELFARVGHSIYGVMWLGIV